MPRPASAQRLLLTAPSPDVFGPGPPAPFVAQTQSLDFTPVETLKSASQVGIGIGDVFTIAMWIRPRTQPLALARTLLRLLSSTTGQSVSISTSGPGASPGPNGVQFLIVNPGFAIRQNVRWGGVFAGPENCWRHVVVQWGGFGSTRLAYVDGVSQGAGSNLTNLSVVVVDDTRTVAFSEFFASTGPEWDGVCASIAMWPTILGAPEILEMFNGGDIAFDLLTDFGNYVSASTLVHWHEVGKKVAPDLAVDSVTTGSPFNLTDAAVGISDADRVVDVPQLPQTLSLNWNGDTSSTDALRNLTDQTLGIANLWSVGFWYEPDAAINRTLLQFRAAATANDSIFIDHRTPNDLLRVITRDSTGLISERQYINQFGGTWTHVLVVWTGATLNTYVDGVGPVAPNSQVNNMVAMIDRARAIGVGNSSFADTLAINGRMSQVQAWRVDVSGARTEIVAGGDPNCLDLNVEFGAYTFQGDLAHWWRPGHEASPNLGKDFALAGFTPTIDIEANVVGLNDADRVADVPT